MHHQDAHGNPLTPASDAALAAYTAALADCQCWRGDPLGTIAAATAAEPGFVMGHVLQAWLHLLGTEPAGPAAARTCVQSAEPLAATARERAHLAAIAECAAGRWRRAARVLEDLSAEHPRDALALLAGHTLDFLLGDSRMLRDRIARALPAWAPGEPGRHALLGMHAFGLEECGDLAEAEAQGRRALALEPADAWAHHAVVHVMETQGRSREGIAFVRERAPHWQDGFFAVHNWWHGALFHLDQDEPDAALALFDGPVAGGGSGQVVDLVDASALLARLALHGVDIGRRWQPVAGRWAAVVAGGGAGHYAFNDWHAAIAALGADCPALLQPLQAGNALAVLDTGRDNAGPAATIVLPLLQALQAMAEQRWAAALPLLRDVRQAAQRGGGSHAQRDLIDQWLLQAALRSGQQALARALLNERLALKPASPALRRLGAALPARA